MKKYLVGLVTGVLVSCTMIAFAAVPSIKSANYTDKVMIEVDGVKQNVEIISVTKEGQVDARNYVSVGDLVPAMGGKVKWIGEKSTVEIKTKDPISVEDEWIPVRDLDKYGYHVSVASSEEVIIYKDSSENRIFLYINVANNLTKIGVKIENQRTYISKTDLMREGIIKE